jgi:hypothetical protein
VVVADEDDQLGKNALQWIGAACKTGLHQLDLLRFGSEYPVVCVMPQVEVLESGVPKSLAAVEFARSSMLEGEYAIVITLSNAQIGVEVAGKQYKYFRYLFWGGHVRAEIWGKHGEWIGCVEPSLGDNIGDSGFWAQKLGPKLPLLLNRQPTPEPILG